ncbi:MAG: MarR family winged helix-turn-helix transcriptional regulator [Chloroflexota bacterium]
MSKLYDHCLAPTGLRTSQFSILARLNHYGTMTINALAADLVMDRTTLGRNILPLQRDGLIAIVQGSSDRRQKELRLTDAGAARLRSAGAGWAAAQTRFETALGDARSAELHALLEAVVNSAFSSISANVAAEVDG